MRFQKIMCLALALAVTTGLASSAFAVTYPSFVNPTGVGNEIEFILNDAADNVTILRDGGNALDLGTLSAGRHTFDLASFSSWEIQVQRNVTAASTPNTNWYEITSNHVENPWARYERGSDVLVNSNPASPLFGTIYVNNVRNVATSGVVRQMEDGIYAITPDLVGVNLTTKAAETNSDDTSLAKKAANWQLGDQTVCGVANTANCQTFLGTVSGWRMSFDQDGNILMGDWSDSNGGIKWINPELTSGGLVLRYQDGVAVVDGTGDPDPPAERIGLIPGPNGEVHGSIASRVYAEGGVGNNLTVYAMDEDFDLDGDTFNAVGNTGNHIWKWNVGNALGQALDGADAHEQPPTLVINTSNIPQTSDGRANWLALNVGIQADALYSPQHDKWYMTQNRSNGDQAGFIVVTADDVDGNSPTLEWSSLQFAIDNNLDGNTNEVLPPDQINDPFRDMLGGMVLSPDGTKLYIHRRPTGTNPILGTTSNVLGSVIVIPLDENGVPALEVAEGQITNIDSIQIASNANSAALRGVTLDAAGNVYTTNNSAERLQIWSPLGNFRRYR